MLLNFIRKATETAHWASFPFRRGCDFLKKFYENYRGQNSFRVLRIDIAKFPILLLPSIIIPVGSNIITPSKMLREIWSKKKKKFK